MRVHDFAQALVRYLESLRDVKGWRLIEVSRPRRVNGRASELEVDLLLERISLPPRGPQDRLRITISRPPAEEHSLGWRDV